ncbi:MAG: hypothetical protein GX483_01820 [Actinomycetaceae bacterium]|nr:hypothetical protein [Actinomycetaceae bacterium]
MTSIQLPVKIVRLDDLNLDLTNYRIPFTPATQQDALLFLFQQEDVMGLATEILTYGYLDNEFPLVVFNEGQYEVIEGNRRVSALKALNNPALIPSYAGALSDLIVRYSTEAADLPSEIRVMVADSRDALQPHIARLHTRQSKKQWAPEQQAKFYFAQIEAGSSVEQIKATYPIKSDRLTRLLKTGSVIRMLDALIPSLSDEEKQRIKAIKFSPLEYVLAIPELCDALGVSFSGSGLMLPAEMSPSQHAQALEPRHVTAFVRLALLMRKENDGGINLNTRHPALKKNASGNERYKVLHFLRTGRFPSDSATDAPNPPGDQSSAPSADTPAGSTSDDPTKAPRPEKTTSQTQGSSPSPERGSGTRRDPLTLKHLDFNGLPEQNLPAGILYRHQELKRIPLDTFPIAASMAMRGLLETALKELITRRPDATTPQRRTMQLKEAMKAVRELYKSRGHETVFNRVYDGKVDKPGSVGWLNDVAHSADLPRLKAEEVQIAFQLIQPVIKYAYLWAFTDESQ